MKRKKNWWSNEEANALIRIIQSPDTNAKDREIVWTKFIKDFLIRIVEFAASGVVPNPKTPEDGDGRQQWIDPWEFADRFHAVVSAYDPDRGKSSYCYFLRCATNWVKSTVRPRNVSQIPDVMHPKITIEDREFQAGDFELPPGARVVHVSAVYTPTEGPNRRTIFFALPGTERTIHSQKWADEIIDERARENKVWEDAIADVTEEDAKAVTTTKWLQAAVPLFAKVLDASLQVKPLPPKTKVFADFLDLFEEAHGFRLTKSDMDLVIHATRKAVDRNRGR